MHVLLRAIFAFRLLLRHQPRPRNHPHPQPWPRNHPVFLLDHLPLSRLPFLLMLRVEHPVILPVLSPVLTPVMNPVRRPVILPVFSPVLTPVMNQVRIPPRALSHLLHLLISLLYYPQLLPQSVLLIPQHSSFSSSSTLRSLESVLGLRRTENREKRKNVWTNIVLMLTSQLTAVPLVRNQSKKIYGRRFTRRRCVKSEESNRIRLGPRIQVFCSNVRNYESNNCVSKILSPGFFQCFLNFYYHNWRTLFRIGVRYWVWFRHFKFNNKNLLKWIKV